MEMGMEAWRLGSSDVRRLGGLAKIQKQNVFVTAAFMAACFNGNGNCIYVVMFL